MVRYPVAPRYAKMLTLARHYDCQSHVVAIVAALTVKVLCNRDGGNVSDTHASQYLIHPLPQNVFQFSEHFDDEDDEDDDGDESGSDKMRQRKRVRQQAVEQWRIEGLAVSRSTFPDILTLFHTLTLIHTNMHTYTHIHTVWR